MIDYFDHNQEMRLWDYWTIMFKILDFEKTIFQIYTRKIYYYFVS